jgi:hypothetical protein
MAMRLDYVGRIAVTITVLVSFLGGCDQQGIVRPAIPVGTRGACECGDAHDT